MTILGQKNNNKNGVLILPTETIPTYPILRLMMQNHLCCYRWLAHPGVAYGDSIAKNFQSSSHNFNLSTLCYTSCLGKHWVNILWIRLQASVTYSLIPIVIRQMPKQYLADQLRHAKHLHLLVRIHGKLVNPNELSPVDVFVTHIGTHLIRASAELVSGLKQQDIRAEVWLRFDLKF